MPKYRNGLQFMSSSSSKPILLGAKAASIIIDDPLRYSHIVVFHGRVQDMQQSDKWRTLAKSVVGKRVLSSCLKAYKTRTHTLISRRALEEIEHEMRHALLYQLTEERFAASHDALAVELDGLRVLLSKTDSKTFKVRKQK